MVRPAAFVFVFLTVVLDMLALGLMVPVLPKLIVALEGGDFTRAARVTGWFGFVFALMQFLASPLLGSLSDRFGRRPVLLISSAGLGLDYVLMAVAPSVSWLFVGRLISGVSAATFATASAYIADITPPEKRAARFGMLGAAFGIGFIVGPALGGWLGAGDLRRPFWFAAACSLLNTVYGLFVLPESLPAEKRAPFRWKAANPWLAVKAVALNATQGWLLLATFLSYLAHESLPSMFVLYTDYRFHWDERMVGMVLGAVGVGSMLVAALLTRLLVARLGERRTLALGLLWGTLGFAVYGWATSSAVFLAGIPLISLMGVSGPSIQALLSAGLEPSRQGQLQGALSSLRGVAGMLGPMLFTQSFALATRRPDVAPIGTPYYLAAALMAGCLLALALVPSRSARARASSVPQP